MKNDESNALAFTADGSQPMLNTYGSFLSKELDSPLPATLSSKHLMREYLLKV